MGLAKKIKESKPVLVILGSAVMVLGITLVLVWWQDVLTLFRGTIGVVIALGGLLLLYMVQE